MNRTKHTPPLWAYVVVATVGITISVKASFQGGILNPLFGGLGLYLFGMLLFKNCYYEHSRRIGFKLMNTYLAAFGMSFALVLTIKTLI